MFDQIDEQDYNEAHPWDNDFEEWVAEHTAWLAMMEDAARIRVNVELREMAAEQESR